MNSSRGCREKSYSSHKREEFGSRNNQGASHHGGGHGNQNYTSNSRPTNIERIHWAFLSCIGKKVVVRLKDGQCWEGIFHVSNIISSTAEPSVPNNYNKKYGVVLKMAQKLLSKGDKPDNQQPCNTLSIADNEFESMRVIMSDASSSWGPSSSTFLTDAEIAKSNVYPESRKLQTCEYLLDKDDSVVGTLEEISEANGDSKPFDQFEVNRRKFGVLSTFNESVYTAPLDKDSEFYKANEASAEKIAHEIESASTKNAHVAEERGQKIDDDCEEKYSSAQPQYSKSRNANNSASYDNSKNASSRNSTHSNAFNRHNNSTNSLHSNSKQPAESTKRSSDQTQQTVSNTPWKKEQGEKPKPSHDFGHRNYDKSKSYSNSNAAKQAYNLNNPGESTNGHKSAGSGSESKSASNDSSVNNNPSHNAGSNASVDNKKPSVQNVKRKLNPNAAEFRYGAGVLELIDNANQNHLNEMQALSMQPYFAQSQPFNPSHTAIPWMQPRSAPMPSMPQPAHVYASIIVPASLEKAGTEPADAQLSTWKDKVPVANLEPLCEIYDRSFEKIMYYHMIIQESWNEQVQPLLGNFKPFTGHYDSQYLQSPYVQCYPQGPYYDYYKVGDMHRPC